MTNDSDALNAIDLTAMTDEELAAHVTRIRQSRTTNQLALELKPKGRAAKADTKPKKQSAFMAALLNDDAEETEATDDKNLL